MEYTEIEWQLRNAVAVDADVATQTMFWTDLTQQAIFRYVSAFKFEPFQDLTDHNTADK